MMTEELRFKICLTIRSRWCYPEIGLIDFDGDESVEQTLFADVTPEQLATLMAEYSMETSISTQGILEGGYISPAVCFCDCDEDTMLSVGPYTRKELDIAQEKAAIPQPTPVLGKDFQFSQMEMSPLNVWGDRWAEIENSMLKWTDETINMWDADKLEDKILKTFGVVYGGSDGI